jgi:glycosyltransferase domain-containing protein
MSYYQKKNYDQHLIIVDGSKKEWSVRKKFEGNYLHLPDVSFRERLIAGLEHSQSELSVLCADDDFLVPAGLEKCTEFLRQNLDYSCAQGYYGRFVIDEGKISYTQKHSGAQNIVNNDSLERVKKAFIPKYIPHVYAVHRRKNLEQVLDYQEMNEFEYIFNFEMLLTILSLIDGKAKRLPVIYNFREMENNKVGISNNNLNTEKIKTALTAFSAYSKRLVEDQRNKNDFLHLINTAVDKLMEYHLFHYNNSVSKKSNMKTNSNNIMLYLAKLKKPVAWVKKINPYSLMKMSSSLFLSNNSKDAFQLNSEDEKRELEIIDETLNNWIKNKNSSLPES